MDDWKKEEVFIRLGITKGDVAEALAKSFNNVDLKLVDNFIENGLESPINDDLDLDSSVEYYCDEIMEAKADAEESNEEDDEDE